MNRSTPLLLSLLAVVACDTGGETPTDPSDTAVDSGDDTAEGGGDTGDTEDSGDTAPDSDLQDTDPPTETDAPTDTDTDTGGLVGVDADADGFDASIDCDDHDPLTYPGAPDACDGIDRDCVAGEADVIVFVPDGGGPHQDLTSASAPPNAPRIVHTALSEPGTLYACDGTWRFLFTTAHDLEVVGASRAGTVFESLVGRTFSSTGGADLSVSDATLTYPGTLQSAGQGLLETSGTATLTRVDVQGNDVARAVVLSGAGSLVALDARFDDVDRLVDAGAAGGVASGLSVDLERVEVTGVADQLLVLDTAASVRMVEVTADVDGASGARRLMGGTAALEIRDSVLRGFTGSVSALHQGPVIVEDTVVTDFGFTWSLLGSDPATLTDVAFEDGPASAAVLFVGSGRTATLEDVSFTRVQRNTMRGVTVADGGALVGTDLVFTDLAGISGAGLHVMSGGTASLTRGTFTGCDAGAGSGGGVFAEGGLSLDGTTFTANEGRYGGAISVGQGVDTVAIDGAVFTSNQAFQGGGVGVAQNATRPVRLTDCTFSANTADAGGAAAWLAGDAEVASSSFADNAALYGPGGVLSLGSGTHSITNTSFLRNDGSPTAVASAAVCYASDVALRQVAFGSGADANVPADVAQCGGSASTRITWGATVSADCAPSGGCALVP